MRIGIVTPAPPGSTRGNRVTAERWGAMLRQLGHDVEIVERFAGQGFDALIVLHAGRSAESIRRFRREHAKRPLLVTITGTDVYTGDFDPVAVRGALNAADRIIVLQEQTARDLPAELKPKIRVIFQSSVPPTRREPQRADVFEIAVVGHLRPVKDPFRAAEAAMLLDATSTIRIVHLGAAMTPDMAERARHEESVNPRYQWLGDLPHEDALAIMARCRLVALTSISEGGPAVIAEAIVAEVPVAASRVSGCVGMLGEDYPGLFPAGDTRALAELFSKAECDASYYESLRSACNRRRQLFMPEAEVEAWRLLLAELRVIATEVH
jgi:putative glycosyltransferase (TIGR04348 family)